MVGCRDSNIAKMVEGIDGIDDGSRENIAEIIGPGEEDGSSVGALVLGDKDGSDNGTGEGSIEGSRFSACVGSALGSCVDG